MRNHRRAQVPTLLCVLVLVLSPHSPAGIISVDEDGPADFITIQAAIDAAVDGDTVVVQPGTYTGAGNRDISFKGKAITVWGVDPNDSAVVATTIVACQQVAAPAPALQADVLVLKRAFVPSFSGPARDHKRLLRD